MKPTLLVLGGIGWCATSPLTYTLQRLAKYSHGGYTKNIYYLNALETPLTPSPALKDRHIRILFDTWEGLETNYGHKLNLPEDLAPLKGFPKKYFNKLVTLPYTLEKYIDYYKALYEQVKPHGYNVVADYQGNLRVLRSVYPQLQEHFNIKVLLIVRDPIRRAVATAKGTHLKHPQKNIIQNNKFTDIGKYFKNYVNTITKTKAVIPNTHVIIMEHLWEDDGTEKKKLEEFLDHPIPQLWPNLYSPDVDHHLTWDLDRVYCPTPCQPPGQSLIPLTPSYYMELRETYKYFYDSWIEEFGSLPSGWGEPIDYDANLQKPNRYTQDMFPPLVYK